MRTKLLVVAVLVTAFSGALSDWKEEETLAAKILEDIDNFVLTGYESPSLEENLRQLGTPGAFRSLAPTNAPALRGSLADKGLCTLCHVAARIVLAYKNWNGHRNLVTNIITKICVLARIEDETVCKGVIDLNIDIILYILENRTHLTSTMICSVLMQSNHCYPASTDSNWTIDIPPRLDVVPKPVVKSSAPPLRILHLTDIHFDEKYLVGGNAECGEPLCCGIDQGSPARGTTGAGAWGDYRSCDFPWHAVQDALEQTWTQNFDIVYFTGDVSNHRVWSTSPKVNAESIKIMYAEFRKLYQNKTLYAILGNHEPSPVNVFAPLEITNANFSTQWLFDLVAEEWSTWLPKSALETVKKGGYYTVLHRPGFRIVTLNSNVAYNLNWWLLYDDKDPYGQLQWLSDTLAQAEKDGEIVHILSHFPVGDASCYKKWNHEYTRIIERFSHIIAAQINGHTHNDEFYVFYNTSDSNQVINIAYNGGSFTPFVDVNPNYRIYELNSTNMMVANFDQYIYNLTAANENGMHQAPNWFKQYSFKEAYGLNSLSYEDIGMLINKFPTDKNLLDLYFRNKVREGDPSLKKGCDDECQENNICTMVTTEFGVNTKCDELTSRYRQKYRI